MTPRLMWEAQACGDAACGSTRIHKLHTEDSRVMQNGDPCPRCDKPMALVTNPTLLASIVYATTGNKQPLRLIRKQAR